MIVKAKTLALALAAVTLGVSAVAQNRWAIQPDGKTIRMEVNDRTMPP